MAKTNVAQPTNLKTHEGAPAKRINAYEQLRRSVMACMLWEKTFYEDGISIAERLAELVPKVDPVSVKKLAVEARHQMNLRHAPLWIAVRMAYHDSHKPYVADTLYEVINRADELAEALSLYWLDGGRRPIAAQVKKGLARAFTKFDAYQLAKYNRDGAIKLRDVLFLTHPEPKDKEQAKIWKQLVEGTLAPPDTWEVALSSGGDKKKHWERLLSENKLGGLALLRNLRNMAQAEVDKGLVVAALEVANFKRVLPFRFISAAQFVPQWESILEEAMLKSLEEKEKLPGKTVLLVDVSGSMRGPLSAKFTLDRYDAANGLAILARELSEEVAIYSFSNEVVRVPDRRGFALRDAIVKSQANMGTKTGMAVKHINEHEPYERLIILTDEQSHDTIPNPTGKGYVINVAAYKNGIGYGAWTNITGWSEAIFQYIQDTQDAE